MPATLVELSGAPVEVVLCSEFRDGPVTGLIRAPQLARSLPGVTELVYGPARRAWRSEPAAERTFLAAPVPAGTSQALLDSCSWPERWRAAPIFDVSCDEPPAPIAALLRPFRADLSKTAPLLMRFVQSWTSIRLWHAPDQAPIDLAAAAEFVPD